MSDSPSQFSDAGQPRIEIKSLCLDPLRVQTIVDEYALLKEYLRAADSQFDGTPNSIRGARFR
jgi:hypothetical protein